MSPGARTSGQSALAGAAGPSAAALEFRSHTPALIATVIGLCLGLPGLSNYGFSVFIAPLRAAFGWSIPDISAWVFFLMLGSCATSVFAGRLVDRHGARAVILVAIPLFAAALALAAWMTGNIWQLRLIALLVGAIGPAVSLLAYSQAVNERFDAARGTALGLMAGGIAISSVVAPSLMQWICDTYGWRSGFTFMGAAALVAFPFAFFWLGKPATPDAARRTAPAAGMTRQEALRAPMFWLIAAIALVVGLYSTGVIFNLMPLLTEAGLSRPTAASYLGLFGLFMFAGKLVCGWALDRFPVPLIGGLILLAQSAALIVLGLRPDESAAVAIAVTGFSTGGQIACSTYTIPRYVGMKAYGQVYGVVQIVGSAGVGAGPYLFSSLRELSSDYRLSLSAAAGLALLAACLYASLGRYRTRPSGALQSTDASVT